MNGAKAGLPGKLPRIRRILDRALMMAERAIKADAGDGGVSTVKAHADLLSQIVRIAEKVHEMEKDIASEADSDGNGPLDEAERAALRDRVESWIEERAGQRLRQMLAENTFEQAGTARVETVEPGNEGGTGILGGGTGSRQ